MFRLTPNPALIVADADLPPPEPPCPVCLGSGWMRAYASGTFPHGPAILAECDACCIVQRRRQARTLDRCQEVAPLFVPTAGAAWDTFLPHDAAAAAMLEAAQRFAAKPSGWLTIWTPNPGAGKSMLGGLIAQAILARGVPCLFMESTPLFAWLGVGVMWDQDNPVDYVERRRWVRGVDVLVIDEFGKESESAATARERFDLLDARHKAALAGQGGATVLLSNKNPDAWPDRYLGSRAKDATVGVVVRGTDVDFRSVHR